MANIAPQCRPGGFTLHPEDQSYELVCAWPEDCYVQWGSSGVVFSQDKPSYEATFFEAFPQAPSTFIRGEGHTLEEAERNAFKKWQRQSACPGHEFAREHWTNGAGRCKHCAMFKANVFDPLTRCVLCDSPTSWSYGVDSEGASHWYCETDAHKRPKDKHPNVFDRFRKGN